MNPKSKEKKDIEALRKRIYNFVVRVVNLVKELPNNLIGNRIGGQLLDAGTSIGANFEEAVAAFLDGRIKFLEIALINEEVLSKTPCEAGLSLAIIRDVDKQARNLAKELILKD